MVGGVSYHREGNLDSIGLRAAITFFSYNQLLCAMNLTSAQMILSIALVASHEQQSRARLRFLDAFGLE